uniref:Uncharacterized protein n=1 Tax=Acrobeloides nanus TaxID=290746 RepID=A0A914DM89_9BILA
MRDPSTPVSERKSSIKCVFVGDVAVGKTSLIVAYTTNGFSDRYNPTTFDKYSVTIHVDNKPVRMDLCDTAGQSDFDSLRLLSYTDADVFLLCFNVMLPNTLNSITDRWLPEIRILAPNIPVILVGLQSDLRMNMNYIIDLSRRGLEPVDGKAVRRLAQQLRMEYIECSALTQHNLKEVFDLAILGSLQRRSPPVKAEKKAPIPICSEKSRSTSFKEGFMKLVDTMTRRFI